MTTKAHFILQGKGGVGKSMVAAMLAQQRLASGASVLCVDTDPVNKTFAGYKNLHVHEIHLMHPDNSRIDQTNFDKLIELILEHDGYEIIIDNGASSFLPLSSYIIENDVVSLLIDAGIDVVVHTVITGGQAMLDTLTGFKALVEQFPTSASILVWVNGYFGKVINAKGESFEGLTVYKNNKQRVNGIINIQEQSELFGMDVRKMLERRMTFEEVALCDDGTLFGIMNKRRILMFKKELFASMSTVLGGVAA